MKTAIGAGLLMMLASACAPFQPTTPAVSASDYTVAGLQQSATLKDPSITYDAAAFVAGTGRDQILSRFGDPNSSRTTDSGLIEDVYAFNPDGSKFVNPQVRPRNMALAFFTMGTSVAVRQARLHLQEQKLTLVHVVYGPDDKLQSVSEEKLQ